MNKGFIQIVWFVDHLFPWFARGANYNYGTSIGVFAFSRDYGQVTGGDSFRVVLYYVLKEVKIS